MYDQLGVPGASRVHVPVPSEAVQRCQRHSVRSLCDGSARAGGLAGGAGVPVALRFAANARAITYDTLLQNAEHAYAECMEANKRTSRLTALLEQIRPPPEMRDGPEARS